MKKERNFPGEATLALKSLDHAWNCKELNRSIPSLVLDCTGK